MCECVAIVAMLGIGSLSGAFAVSADCPALVWDQKNAGGLVDCTGHCYHVGSGYVSSFASNPHDCVQNGAVHNCVADVHCHFDKTSEGACSGSDVFCSGSSSQTCTNPNCCDDDAGLQATPNWGSEFTCLNSMNHDEWGCFGSNSLWRTEIRTHCPHSCNVCPGWSAWTTCSELCGGGTRTRTCTNPAPMSGSAATCYGNSMESCNTDACINGGWGSFGECSVQCGGGTQTRACDSPAPGPGGADCVGSSTQTCNEQACVHGGWTDFGPCDNSCGEGVRTRTCENPPPGPGGNSCVGNSWEACDTSGALVVQWQLVGSGGCRDTNGDSHFSYEIIHDFTQGLEACKSRCDAEASRCTGIEHFGSPSNRCQLQDFDIAQSAGSSGSTVCWKRSVVSCSAEPPSPIDGNFTEWTACNGTCAGSSDGFQRRECTNPPPLFGGADCVGERTRSCVNAHIPCPIDGEFSAWSVCSKTCGNGTQHRSCDSPAPAHGGAECEGPTTRPCNTQDCPALDARCPTSGVLDVRQGDMVSCLNQCYHVGEEHVNSFIAIPTDCASDASSLTADTERCTSDAHCHVGKVSCSKSDVFCTFCANTSSFTCCDDNGGLQEALDSTMDSCHTLRHECQGTGSRSDLVRSNCPATCGLCPVDGRWSAWSSCSVFCGSGGYQTRSCTNPSPAYNGAPCEGESTRECSASEPCEHVELTYAFAVMASACYADPSVLSSVIEVIVGAEMSSDYFDVVGAYCSPTSIWESSARVPEVASDDIVYIVVTVTYDDLKASQNGTDILWRATSATRVPSPSPVMNPEHTNLTTTTTTTTTISPSLSNETSGIATTATPLSTPAPSLFGNRTVTLFIEVLQNLTLFDFNRSIDVYVRHGVPYMTSNLTQYEQRFERENASSAYGDVITTTTILNGTNGSVLTLEGSRATEDIFCTSKDELDAFGSRTLFTGSQEYMGILHDRAKHFEMPDGPYALALDGALWFMHLEKKNVSGSSANIIREIYSMNVAYLSTDSVLSVWNRTTFDELVEDALVAGATSPGILDNVDDDTNTFLGADMIVAYAACLAVIVASISFFVWHSRYRRKRQLEKERFDSTMQGLNERLENMRREIDLQEKAWNVESDEVRLVKEIARGGFGTVWRGVLHEKWDVAVKLLAKSSGNDAAEDKEIAFLMRARHPKLVWFIGCGKQKTGDIFVVLEFMECGSLDAYMWGANPKDRPWGERLSLLFDVANGMEYLQCTLSSIHRDLKSPNILLGKENGRLCAKVADFGMSRLIRQQNAIDSVKSPKRRPNATFSRTSWAKSKTSSKTNADIITSETSEFIPVNMTSRVGTPNWCAPEVIRCVLQGKKVGEYSQAVDAYSFGIIMWEVLSLRAPWKTCRFAFDIFKRVEKGERPRIDSQLAGSAPKDYVEIMKRCWAQRPSDRPLFDATARNIETMRSAACGSDYEEKVRNFASFLDEVRDQVDEGRSTKVADSTVGEYRRPATTPPKTPFVSFDGITSPQKNVSLEPYQDL